MSPIITKERLTSMSEADLRSQVLMPLYRSLEYQNVCEYHGTSEKGKDIVATSMVNGQATHLAIVAKATNISGKVTGRSSTGEVYIQVRQAFHEGFPHPTSGQHVIADQCHIVTSKKILLSARESLSKMLEHDGLLSKVKFIDGEELWVCIQANLTTRTIQNAHNEIADYRDNADPFYRIHQIPFGDKGILIHAQLKDPSKELTAPDLVKYTFSFDETTEGINQSKALQDLIDRGISASISGKYISKHEMRDSIRMLVDPHGQGLDSLILHSLVLKEPGPVKLELLVNGRVIASIPYVELWQTRTGRLETHYSSRHFSYPLIIDITVKRTDSEHIMRSLSMELNRAGHSTNRLQEAIRFMYEAGIADLGSIKITRLKESSTFMNFSAEPSSGEKIQSSNLTLKRDLILLEKLNDIAQTTNSAISWPDRELSEKDYRDIFYWHKAILKGDFSWTGDYSIDLSLDRNQVRQCIDYAESTNCYVMVREHEEFTFTVIDNSVSMTSVEVRGELMRWTHSSIEKMREYLKSRARNPIIVRMRIIPGWTIRGRFTTLSNKGSLRDEEIQAIGTKIDELPDILD